jgi:SPP1 gp7 family putative phage head morphogenesis protein
MAVVQRMREAYANALEGVMDRLAEIRQEIDDLEAQGIAPDRQTVLLRQRFDAAGAELLAAINEYERFAVEQTRDGQLALIDFAVDSASRVADIASQDIVRAGVRWDLKTPSRDVLDQLVGFAGDGSPLAAVYAEVGPAAQLMLEQLAPTGIGPRAVADGMVKVGQASYRRMETIARTEMIRAAREANRQTYMANADVLDGWVRACAGDSRVCMVCWALHGTMHKTSEIMPSHPNCRCVMVPVPKSLAELSGDPEAPDVRPRIPTKEELFDTLTADEQREILGKGRYERWRNGMSLSRFGRVEIDPVWGPTAVPVGIAELGD